MNRWLQLSLDYASQRSYLDDLFQVYPTIPEGIRELDSDSWEAIEDAFNRHDNLALLKGLLKLDLFPIKDSYVAYLKRDSSALTRNPATVARLCGRLYELGLTTLFTRCSEPKETNRQIGPLFRRWLHRTALGVQPVKQADFLKTKDNAILDASDAEAARFARKHLNYHHAKGLDLVARFNGKYVVGEAKFLTDFGGHQNAQFNDAIATINTKGLRAVPVAILDGVVYIKGKNRMYKDITTSLSSQNIVSSLVLREFLYQL